MYGKQEFVRTLKPRKSCPERSTRHKNKRSSAQFLTDMRIIRINFCSFLCLLCLTQALPLSDKHDKILRMRIISDLAEIPLNSHYEEKPEKKEFWTQDHLNKLFRAFRVAAEMADMLMKLDQKYHQDHPNEPNIHQDEPNHQEENIDTQEIEDSNVINNVKGISVPRPLSSFHPTRIRNENGDLKKGWDNFDWEWWFVDSKARRPFTPFDFKIIG